MMKPSVIKLLAIILLIVLLSYQTVWATCSTSDGGNTYNCTAGTTVSQVNSVLSSANNNAVVNFAAGSYTWGSNIDFSNLSGRGISLIGAGAGSSTVNMSGGTFIYYTWDSNTNLLRISGFTFNNCGTYFIDFYGDAGDGTADTLTQFRFDNNVVNAVNGADVIRFGEGSAWGSTKIYGSIDNNTFQASSTSARYIQYQGPANTGLDSGSYSGTSKNLFIEDNKFLNATQDNVGLGCIDANWGAALVIRNNYATNCSFKAHGLYGSWNWGVANYEVYDNEIRNTVGQNTSGYRAIHHQGSNEFIAFNNIIHSSTNSSDAAIGMLNYRSCSELSQSPTACDGNDASHDGNRSPTESYYGYPCYRQLGRLTDGTAAPMYFWNNRWDTDGDGVGDSKLDISFESYCTNDGTYHVIANRDWYEEAGTGPQSNSSTPFDGTTGMGFGTLANRPSTCTPTSEALDVGYAGVGYFATDVGNHGTLYNCSATNTWSVYYTPYDYPHPLRTNDVQPPQNLRIEE